MYFPTILTLLLSAGHVSAVGITLVGNSKREQRCGKLTNPWGACTNAEIAKCCKDDDLTAYSVSGEGLYTDGVPDQLVAYGFGGCETSCNSGGGSNYECVDCTDGQEVIGGAAWYHFGGLDAREEQAIVGSAKPDIIGLYDYSLGDYRVFRVDDDVPADIVAEIKQGFRNTTNAEDLNLAVKPFEIKQKS